MQRVGKVVSVQVGRVATYRNPEQVVNDGRTPEWVTAFWKQSVVGPTSVTVSGLEGDAQADTVHHGGADKAVLAYAFAHYTRWHSELDIPIQGGGFGENLTMTQFDEDTVCIGDVFAIGSVRLQVSQTRVPCWKISRRWGIPDLLQQVQNNGRTGWYLRVLESGSVESGQEVNLLERTQPNWTIARLNDVVHGRVTEKALLLEALALPELADAAKEIVRSRLQRVN